MVYRKDNLGLSPFLYALSADQGVNPRNKKPKMTGLKPTFAKRVIDAVVNIEKGETLTYKDVAKRAGNVKAARAVGNILNKHYLECRRKGQKTIPCHRVIRSDGKIGGYVLGEKEKIEKLKEEKIIS